MAQIFSDYILQRIAYFVVSDGDAARLRATNKTLCKAVDELSEGTLVPTSHCVRMMQVFTTWLRRGRLSIQYAAIEVGKPFQIGRMRASNSRVVYESSSGSGSGSDSGAESGEYVYTTKVSVTRLNPGWCVKYAEEEYTFPSLQAVVNALNEYAETVRAAEFNLNFLGDVRIITAIPRQNRLLPPLPPSQWFAFLSIQEEEESESYPDV